MIPILLRYWHFAAIGLLTVLFGVQTARIASLKASHAEYVASAEKARAEAVAGILTRERASARISQEKAEAHEKTIADLRAAAARRLQAYTGKPGPVPSVPSAAFRANAKACGDGFSLSASDAVSLMLAADENTAQLIDLQAWVSAQQKVTP